MKNLSPVAVMLLWSMTNMLGCLQRNTALHKIYEAKTNTFVQTVCAKWLCNWIQNKKELTQPTTSSTWETSFSLIGDFLLTIDKDAKECAIQLCPYFVTDLAFKDTNEKELYICESLKVKSRKKVLKYLKWYTEFTRKKTPSVSSNAPVIYTSETLIKAAKEGNVTLVKAIIDNGTVDLNTMDIHGKTSLIYAIQNNHIEISKALIAAKPVHLGENNKNHAVGTSPLIWAVKNGQLEIVKLLIQRKDIDINKVDNLGKTALHYAAARGHTAIVRLLIGHPDIDIDIADSSGKTPLHLAVMTNHTVKADSNGKVPLDYSRNIRINREIILLLLAHMDIRFTKYRLLMKYSMLRDIFSGTGVPRNILRDLAKSI